MNRSIFGAFLIIALTIASTLPAQERQDTQRNKSEYKQKKKNKDCNNDTMSNRRMHDYHAPNSVDTPPMHRQPAPVPIPDTVNHNMH